MDSSSVRSGLFRPDGAWGFFDGSSAAPAFVTNTTSSNCGRSWARKQGARTAESAGFFTQQRLADKAVRAPSLSRVRLLTRDGVRWRIRQRSGLRLALPSAPAFREGLNVLFPGTEEIQKVSALFVNNQLALAQFYESMLFQETEERRLMPGEEFHKSVVADIARGNQQKLGWPLTELEGDLKIRVLGDQHALILICQGQKHWILRPVLSVEVKCVDHVMPALPKPESQTARQLGINQDLQAARGNMRWTLASRAANARQALMSSRSRSG